MPEDDRAAPHAATDGPAAPEPPAEPPVEPATEPGPQVLLDHIAEVSRNAAATWFGLLGLLAFVGITLLGHRDVDFFARGAGTQLPLVNITVPVEAFFLAAPALVAAVYAYFHLYLMTLWDALAETPPRIDNQPLSDRVHPWLISYAALWYRDRRRRDGSSAPRELALVVVGVAVLFGWLFGILVLTGLWLRSIPAHDELLTLWSGACLCFATLIGLTGFASAANRMAGATRAETAGNHGVRWHWPTAFIAFVAFLSWETTEGTVLTWTRSGQPILLISANLREAELTPRPPDWKPFELWLRDLRRDRGIGDPDENPLIPTVEEIVRYQLMIASLDAPDLEGRDLRGAVLRGAYLPGTDLEWAEMQGADLVGAEMQGADLVGARLQGADLVFAQMQGADLNNAKMQGAALGNAQLQGANLNATQMKGADVGGAQMQGAHLAWAEMQGVDLGGASMQGADCTKAIFFAALVPSADLSCFDGTLEQAQLQVTVGNDRTRLPTGLKLSRASTGRSCRVMYGHG